MMCVRVPAKSMHACVHFNIYFLQKDRNLGSDILPSPDRLIGCNEKRYSSSSIVVPELYTLYVYVN